MFYTSSSIAKSLFRTRWNDVVEQIKRDCPLRVLAERPAGSLLNTQYGQYYYTDYVEDDLSMQVKYILVLLTDFSSFVKTFGSVENVLTFAQSGVLYYY